MIYDIAGRQGGKTTRALDWVYRGNARGEKRAIIVHTSSEASRLARRYGVDPRSILPAQSVSRHRGANYDGVVVDDLDLILSWLWGGLRVVGVTGTGIVKNLNYLD